MKTSSIKTRLASIVSVLCLATGAALGDAPLKTALDLGIEQAAKVDEIQKKARDAVRPVREELNREERALRRARIANDAGAVARQETLIAPLREKLAGIFANESGQIRAVLTAEQKPKYEEYLKIRDAMAGSSRDVKEFQKAEKPAE
jgi:Spy/CpxP family protein refolding chaperone